MRGQSRIRTPIAQRWHRFRQSVLPVICFVGCAGFTLWLWDRQARMGNGFGEVHGLRVDVATSTGGLLVSHTPPPDPQFPLPVEQEPFWSHLQRVNKGDVIARLDDTLLRAEVVTMEGELRALREEVTATQAQLELDKWVRETDSHQETVRLAVQIETYRVDIAERQAQIAWDTIEVQRRQSRLDYFEKMANKGQISAMDSNDIRLEAEGLKASIKGNEAAVKTAQSNLLAAEERQREFSQREGYPQLVQQRVDEILAPLREAVSAKEAEINQLNLQVAAMVINAPISGEIVNVFHRPGESIPSGEPIVTIAATEALYLVSYVRQQQRVQLATGMKVRLRARQPGSPAFESQIDVVGPRVELVPLQQLSDPTIPEWGLPVRIPVPPEMNVRPGELLDIVFPPPNRSG